MACGAVFCVCANNEFMGTVREHYLKLKNSLNYTGEGDAEALLIISHLLNCDPGKVFLKFDEQFTRQAEAAAILAKRLGGMPLAYAIKSKNFYGYDFYVDERVLVPRSDTECVVEHALCLIAQSGYKTALDICCGSGCIGVTLFAEAGALQGVDLADISPRALEVAKINAGKISPGGNFGFILSDMFKNIAGSYDIIVSNPPYISEGEYSSLEAQVRDFEPSNALLAQDEGYEFYIKLAKAAPRHLNPGGALVIETGACQHELIKQLLEAAGFVNIFCGNDLQGRPRFISATPGKRENYDR